MNDKSDKNDKSNKSDKSDSDKSDTIQKAQQLAKESGQFETPFKVTAFDQASMMVDLLKKLGLDEATLAAAFVYEPFRYGRLDHPTILKTLGTEVTELVDGLKKMHAVDVEQEIELSENLRRMLLALVQDVRVVLIRLAEHTIELRLCENLDEATKRRYAKNTQEIYAPLANRLGIGQLKWELEDLAFKYAEPIQFQSLFKLIQEQRVHRETDLKSIIELLEKVLNKEGIQAKVTGRVKHISSIWKKMQRKKVQYEEIYDVQAIRVLVPTVKDCYAVLGLVHGLWQHIPKEFDDYIANPKGNGYQSLHTAVIGPEGKTLEVQIRTFEMHEQSELGVAAHWLYKEGLKKDLKYQQQLANLRQILKWQEEWTTDPALREAIKKEVFQDWIYVLTPKGEVFELPSQATVLDFAYQLHTEVGHRCRGAKVNGRIVPLHHLLKSGDQIQILTTARGGPSRDWLNPHLGYLNTVKARAKVHHWFKYIDRDKNIHEGRELLDRELKRVGAINVNFEALAHHLKYKNVDDMLAALGASDLRVGQILSAIQTLTPNVLQKTAHKPFIKEASSQGAPRKKSSAEVQVSGMGNILCQMARCCKPVPFDEIIGYIALGKGITVHRKDCVNILRASHLKIPRLIQVAWGERVKNQYTAELSISGYDRSGLINDVCGVFAGLHVNVVDLKTSLNRQDNIATLRIMIEIPSLLVLSHIVSTLQKVPNVFSVQRVTG